MNKLVDFQALNNNSAKERVAESLELSHLREFLEALAAEGVVFRQGPDDRTNASRKIPLNV